MFTQSYFSPIKDALTKDDGTTAAAKAYDLYVRDTTVNFTGKEKRAIAVNGQIPMPTLTFTEGDTAEIYVHNELNEETSIALARFVFAQQRRWCS
jgi:FtsP/CotA-like multicopper oxidase with cupredoxin domain